MLWRSRLCSPGRDVPKDPDAKDAETPAENPKPAFDPAVPLGAPDGRRGLGGGVHRRQRRG